MGASLEPAKHRAWPLLLVAYLIAAAIGTLAMLWAKAPSAGFTGADEPSHFLNGYFISTYLKDHFGSNPMAFATDYYIHYPKISIGHWPPAYYGLLSLYLLVAPASYTSVFLWNVAMSSLPALGVAAALNRLSGRAAALVGVVLYMFTPLVLDAQPMFMVDQPLAAAVVAATAIWMAYSHRPSWGRALAFAGMAAFAVLVKGNGWLMLFIPFFHAALTGRWRPLVSVKLVVAAAFAALAVVPWYLLTTKIAADGFNYHAGPAYALRAALANMVFLAHNVSWVGVALASYAIVVEFRARALSPQRWTIVSGVISLLLATLTLQSLVPADIVDRYMAPALPAVIVLAMLGALRTLDALAALRGGAGRLLASTALCVLLLWPGIDQLQRRAPKADTGAAEVARMLAPSSHPAVTVIDGGTGHEGAFIAAMAVRDPGLNSYVVRSSKLLADSNFMGTVYALKFAQSAQVMAELRRLGVRYVVIMRGADQPSFPHSEQLRSALAAPDSGYCLRERLAHRNRAGTTEVYEAIAPIEPNVAEVRSMGVPSKVNALIKTL